MLALVLGIALPWGASVSASTGPIAFTRHVAPYGLPNVGLAGEPTLGINWRTGAVMFQAGSSTYSVMFDDVSSPAVAVWTDRTPPASVVNIDPLLYVDSATGRTFAGGLDGACSVLSVTDDDGLAWSPVANSCAGADHPSIASGPWSSPRPLTAVHPRAVYYCAQASVVACATSLDGGVTFGPGVTVVCQDLNPGHHGSLTIGPNGWLYLPFRTCGGDNGMSVSKDNGLTWSGQPLRGATAPDLGFDPDVGVSTNNWAYLGYPTADHGAGVALTKDGGLSWTRFGDVAASAGIVSTAFHEVVSGDDDRAAIVYLGSEVDGDPHAPDFLGDWHVYVTYTLDAGATWETIRASDNVVQRGWICADGTSCSTGRNLLDFMDAQLDARGHILVAYADGCTAACELDYAPSFGAHATILRQSGGPGMYRAFDAGDIENVDVPGSQIRTVSEIADDILTWASAQIPE